MGLAGLLDSTRRDVDRALDTAVARVLARDEFTARIEDLGFTTEQVTELLEERRDDMLAGVTAAVTRLDRVRRAQERLRAGQGADRPRKQPRGKPGRAAPAQAAPGKAGPARVAPAQAAPAQAGPARSRAAPAQAAPAPTSSRGRGTKTGSALRKRIPERQPAVRSEGGQLWQNLDDLARTVMPDLTRQLEELVVAPQVRRLLNRLRHDQVGQEVLYATDLGDLDTRRLRARVDEDLFVPTRSLRELGRLISQLPSGSVGVAGSRGAGKSTALAHVDRVLPGSGSATDGTAEGARAPRRTGAGESFRVDVSAPTEYVPHEFLMHLLGEVATEWLHQRHPAAKVEREESLRAKAVALTVTAVVPAVLLVVGGWSLAAYVARTGLSTPAVTMPVVVAIVSVLVAGYVGRQAGLRLHRTWSLMVGAAGIELSPPDELGDLAPTTYTTRVIMLTTATMAGLAAVIMWADAYPLADRWTSAEFAAVLVAGVAAAGMGGSAAAMDFHLARSTSPIGTMVAVVLGTSALAVALQALAVLVLADFVLSGQVVLGAAFTAAAVCCATLRLGIRGEPRAGPEQRSAADLAREDLRRLRFQRSSAVGTTTALKAGASAALSFEASRGVSRSVTDVEARLTVPETVQMIRRLLEAIHDELAAKAKRTGGQARIVIAIDEMDKLEASDRAREFLNEIKGVFGIEGVVFLVSVSEDAMASFERRGLAFRDAFDSAFDEVVHLPQLSFQETCEMLRAKVFPEMPVPFVALAHCLAGGLARDVVRTVHHIAECEPPRTVQEVTSATLHRELRGKWKGAVSALRPLPLEPHVTDLILVMYRIDRCPEDVAVDERCLMRGDAFEEVDRLRLRTTKDADLPDLRTLLRLAGEYVGFAYFCRTLNDFFGTPDEALLVRRLRRAIADDVHERHTLDYLARARYHLAVKPRLGWEAISYFREQHGLEPVLRYPPVLLGKSSGSSLPRTSASRAHVGAGPKVSLQRPS